MALSLRFSVRMVSAFLLYQFSTLFIQHIYWYYCMPHSMQTMITSIFTNGSYVCTALRKSSDTINSYIGSFLFVLLGMISERNYHHKETNETQQPYDVLLAGTNILDKQPLNVKVPVWLSGEMTSM